MLLSWPWPDVTFVSGLLHGFPAIGFCGLLWLPSQHLGVHCKSPLCPVHATLRLCSAKFVQVRMMTSGFKDEANGWCTPAHLPPPCPRAAFAWCDVSASCSLLGRRGSSMMPKEAARAKEARMQASSNFLRRCSHAASSSRLRMAEQSASGYLWRRSSRCIPEDPHAA